jgi:predicted NBD/HSP70 family sugar kinase
MNLRLIDIGGSGLKTAILKLSNIQSLAPQIESRHFDKPNWDDFAGWLAQQGLLDSEVLGISCAGFITLDGIVKLCRVAGWRDKPLVRETQMQAPGTQVFLLNDAEAHLMAHMEESRCPMLNVALGTSLGFAMADANGQLVRALDGLNFDLGEIPLPTSAAEKKVWWALGSAGLAALQKQHGGEAGAAQFGYRLGAFLATLCGLFRPKTIVLSGGITAHWWDHFHSTMETEFSQSIPAWCPTPTLVRSPFARDAALIGMALYSARQIEYPA